MSKEEHTDEANINIYLVVTGEQIILPTEVMWFEHVKSSREHLHLRGRGKVTIKEIRTRTGG